MAKHNNTGKQGELLAREWLIEKEYDIIHFNWRYRHLEVDIIAKKNNILHFIEVKTRTSLRFGFPEDNVSAKKIRDLICAADEYTYQHPQWKMIQFDILSININTAENKTDYFLIEDVYE